MRDAPVEVVPSKESEAEPAPAAKNPGRAGSRGQRRGRRRVGVGVPSREETEQTEAMAEEQTEAFQRCDMI